jgi:hypothetical protein
MAVKYIAFYEGYTMTQLVEGVEQLYNRLSAWQSPRRTVEFCDIRSAMLQSPIINHNHVFRPSNMIDVELGDLGYFRNTPGNTVGFRKLDNIIDQLGDDIYHYPRTIVSVSPNGQWHQDRNSDGSIRHFFSISFRFLCRLISVGTTGIGSNILVSSIFGVCEEVISSMNTSSFGGS